MNNKIFIGGEWTTAAEGGTMDVLNPATGETIAQVPACTAADVDAAVEAAKAALPEWLDSTPAERAEVLLTLADVIDENADELAEIESRNVGKPLSYAKDEMPVCSDNLRFFAGAARILEGKAAGEYMKGYTSMIRREPLGIVGGIAPWNYPLMMAVWKLAPALAAGNVQVLKPSEQTPLSLLRFAELAQDAIPAGVLNVVTGDGVPVGERIVTHPDVRLVSLTGDVETGKTIARAAADNLKRVHLELGGKAPVIVFDDADPAAVAEGIKIAGYWNSGQDCTAASRVMAGPGIYDQLLEELVPAVESLKVGDPAEGDEIEMGPVISKAQQERVLGFLDRAERRRPCSPAAARTATAASSSSRPWSPTSARPTRSSSARSSARSSPCSGSRATRRRSRGRTTSATASRRRSGRATSAGRSARPARSSSARSGSTTTSRSSRRCRTAATRSPATARTSRRTRSRTTRRSST